MMKNVFLFLFFLLLFILIIVLDYYHEDKLSRTCPSEHYSKTYFHISYKGVISKKYVERMSHGAKYIDVEAKDTTLSLHIAHNNKYNTPLDKRFWDYVLEGDSITKHKNSHKITIKRGKESIDFDVDCEYFRKRRGI